MAISSGSQQVVSGSSICSDLCPRVSPVENLAGREVKEITYIYSKAGNTFIRGIKWIRECIRVMNLFTYFTALIALPAATFRIRTSKNANFAEAYKQGYNASELSINMGGRTSVGYTFTKKENPNNKWLMVSLGNGEDAEDEISRKLYYEMAEHLGADNIAFINYCGVGKSNGRASKSRGIQDVKALREYLAREKGAKGIYHYAHSLGGGYGGESYRDGEKPETPTVLIQSRTFDDFSKAAQGIAGQWAGIASRLAGWNLKSQHSNCHVPTIVLQTTDMKKAREITAAKVNESGELVFQVKFDKKMRVLKHKLKKFDKKMQCLESKRSSCDEELLSRSSQSRIERKKKKYERKHLEFQKKIKQRKLEIRQGKISLASKEKRIIGDEVISANAALATALLRKDNRSETVVGIPEKHGHSLETSTMRIVARIAKKRMQTSLLLT